MKRLLCTIIAAALALAAPAAAKNITAAKVCGADGCRTIDQPTEQLLMGGPPTSGPTNPSPFVKLSFHMGGNRGEAARTWFFPRAKLVLDDDRVHWMRPAALALMLKLAREVRPFPASQAPHSGFPAPEPVTPPAPAPVPADTGTGGGSDWWWALLLGPIVLALGLWLVRRRGTNDRREVYGLGGAGDGQRPGGTSEAR